ncbi:glycosyltransferase [Pedobacter sp. SYSU D00535]|uniref:glycosyltransferase n=1 Tax=Pedobacter sp. SYSU D00535 TaxID=2810308 RepID=UPI001A95788B|nr:glycosyltransferase [Pedobacter sp. SYSU D00535]
MKKKVYFILSSLRAGGSERVFWLLSQYFDKSQYDVSLILLDSRDPFFSPQLEGIRTVHLNTIRVSRSFFKLFRLIKKEKPHAVFTTGGHINALLSFISLFVKIPFLIGREANVLELMVTFEGSKGKLLDMLIGTAYKRIDVGVCQSDEVKRSLSNRYRIPNDKLVVIPNPVIPVQIIKASKAGRQKRLIVVARLAREKGLLRLLEIMKELPENYSLNIVGEGPLREELETRIGALGLRHRVELCGQVARITDFIAGHDLMLLTSFTEGFPNAVVEALSVGVPVVSFRVSGISAIITNGFNGYIIEQNDLDDFRVKTIIAGNQCWDNRAIREDVIARFGIDKVVAKYESLIA